MLTEPLLMQHSVPICMRSSLVAQKLVSSFDFYQLHIREKRTCEKGWDYTARWFINPNATNGLQSLNVRSTIPIDLNSILCEFFSPSGVYYLQREFHR